MTKGYTDFLCKSRWNREQWQKRKLTCVSGFNAGETRPGAEASTRAFSVGRKSQLISTSHQEPAVDGDQNPSGVYPESVLSAYNLGYNQQISGANPFYVYNDIYYSNV